MTGGEPPRLREHPEQRLAAPVLEYALAEVAAHLRQEPGGGQHGHRQQVLHKHGPMTIALFNFDQGAALPEHAAAGAVAIQVLQGELEVRAAGHTHTLAAGRLLDMAPGIPHDVRALTPASMLLTVSLDPNPATPRPATP